ncbi:hypothetical protein ACFQL1_20465 [Halomicroarcula sp. GCM10025709]|uniref:hypothetical protein n=1 Tax=Halomicroarcula sp. GCM10025709 TaxID=3252669 RepID=UPI0036105453
MTFEIDGPGVTVVVDGPVTEFRRVVLDNDAGFGDLSIGCGSGEVDLDVFVVARGDTPVQVFLPAFEGTAAAGPTAAVRVDATTRSAVSTRKIRVMS